MTASIRTPTPTGDNGAAATGQIDRHRSGHDDQPPLWSPLSPETGGGDREPHPDRAQRYRNALRPAGLEQASRQAQVGAPGATLEVPRPLLFRISARCERRENPEQVGSCPFRTRKQPDSPSDTSIHRRSPREFAAGRGFSHRYRDLGGVLLL